MTEQEMWSIFEKCDGDPVMISQFIDWILENDCFPDLKLITDTLLWMRDNGKWPHGHSMDSMFFWGGHRKDDGVVLSHRLPLEVFEFLPLDCTGNRGLKEVSDRRPVLAYSNLKLSIEALDHALREMKSKFHRKEPTAFMRR